MFARLLGNFGLILLDPLDLRLHKIAQPIFTQAIEQRDSLEQQLLDRGEALEKAGYAAQVKVTSRSTVLFHISRDGRQAISSSAGSFESGSKSWTQPELLSAIQSEPENFSPNALLRPVIQDFLLPTVACIGGPSRFHTLPSPKCSIVTFSAACRSCFHALASRWWTPKRSVSSPIRSRSRGRVERPAGASQAPQQGQRAGKRFQFARGKRQRDQETPATMVGIGVRA